MERLALEGSNTVPPGAPLGQLQFVERNGRRIPLHGGPTLTTYNAMDNELIPNLIRLPFTREDVAAHAIAPPLVLRASP